MYIFQAKIIHLRDESAKANKKHLPFEVAPSEVRSESLLDDDRMILDAL